MPADIERLRRHLHAYDFSGLLVEELGWNHYDARPVSVQVDEFDYILEPAAEKAGFAVYICGPDQNGAVPPYPVRRKIERQVAKVAFEHMIVFVDAGQTIQVWQWVKREGGKPAACHEQDFREGQRGDALLQRLQGLAFDLEEEEKLDIPMVALRVQQALDVEKVTKRFYDHFKKELETFQGLIGGINDQNDREWYASLMLNRMMFIYFIQKQGFLDTDQDYLQNRLRMVQEKSGQERFQHFYRMFLLRLFHEGLGQPESERAADLAELLGTVPYLNGGLFDVHRLEQNNPDIQIPDEAFENIFSFFDEYRWHLDERPHQADNEINPDVLGYIFEKYINQKQMGGYYTKEDITGYITQNTVIPFLFDAAQKECPAAFASADDTWGSLRDNPDRYIYPAMCHGITWDARKMPPQPLKRAHDLPVEIAVGIDDVSERGDWNLPAPEEYGLPRETWREVVARRQRHEEIRGKLASGKVHDINDLITLNLKISQFAEDVIVQSESPELVQAFWHALNNVSILDPTCGSGAFLFAALNILEPLYNACLEGMKGFVDDAERSGESHPLGGFSDFRKILNETDDTLRHPNQRYFVLKSIILNNLYGVDIMEEAVEICKLRLFLKMIAQVKGYDQIEPLPDIDFNIMAGNSLVGFTSLDAVRQAITMGPTGQHRMLYAEDEATLTQIEEDAKVADWAFEEFRKSQSGLNMDIGDFKTGKELLKDSLVRLRDQLDSYMAAGYGVELNDTAKYERWRKRCLPFHWFVEFYGVMKNGGFDVTIGNPPYVEYSTIRSIYTVGDYRSESCGNLFAFVAERCCQMLSPVGSFGLIFPISGFSTPRMAPLMGILTESLSEVHVSYFAVRPGKLFDGADMNLSIVIARGQEARLKSSVIYATDYMRWYIESRPELFAGIRYAATELSLRHQAVPKTGTITGSALLDKIRNIPNLSRFRSNKSSGETIYYHSGGRYHRKCLRERLSNEYKPLEVRKGLGAPLICLLSSSFYYWFWITMSDCFHVTKGDVDSLPVPDSLADDTRFEALSDSLIEDLWKNATIRMRNRADGSQRREVNFNVGKSVDIITTIDRMLASHYDLTDEELDFIINYDIKFRKGQDAALEE